MQHLLSWMNIRKVLHGSCHRKRSGNIDGIGHLPRDLQENPALVPSLVGGQ